MKNRIYIKHRGYRYSHYLQLKQKKENSKTFPSVELGYEPIIKYMNKDITIIGIKHPETLDHDSENGTIIDPSYVLNEFPSRKFLNFEAKIDSGMSGGFVWHDKTQKVIGITKRKIVDTIKSKKGNVVMKRFKGMAIPISDIVSYLRGRKIPKVLEILIEKIYNENLKSREELSFLNKYEITMQLNGKSSIPYRPEGPQWIDFESKSTKSWVYKPEIVETVLKHLHSGEIVILGGKPATGKSVITRYVGYKAKKRHNINIYYIDFISCSEKNINEIYEGLNEYISRENYFSQKSHIGSPLIILETFMILVSSNTVLKS